MSLVRANTEKKIGSLLKDPRRLNVAFSRAMHKFIAVGSLSTFLDVDPMHTFVQQCRENNWVLVVVVSFVILLAQCLSPLAWWQVLPLPPLPHPTEALKDWPSADVVPSQGSSIDDDASVDYASIDVGDLVE